LARPRIVDRVDSLQAWMVAVNISGKQTRIADKGWSSSFGVGKRTKTPHRKGEVCYETLRWFSARRMRSVGHEARMGEKKCAQNCSWEP